METWLAEEEKQGAPNPREAVLATTGLDFKPYDRVVAIREMLNGTLLFFTQSTTKKLAELKENPTVTLIFWLELMQREIVIEGDIEPLNEIETERYWQT